MNSKSEIRKEIKRQLREQGSRVRTERSLLIQEKLLSDINFRECSVVMIYVSLPEEVDTKYLIEEALKLRKRVVVPYIQQDNNEISVSEITSMENLEKGLYNILQPKPCDLKSVPLEKIDLVVVPAIAFDKKNMRLGRGKGYFDRFLSKKSLCNVETIGLAFDFQVKESLPYEDHDKPVGRVLTN